jgi:uncharacterized membrane protein YfcA
MSLELSWWWSVAFVAIFLIGVTKSGFGSGVGLMIVPMMAIAMGHIPGWGSEAALGLLLVPLVVGDVIAVYQYRRLFLVRKQPAVAMATVAGPPTQSEMPSDRGVSPALAVVRRMLPGTMVGVVLGGLLLWWFHQQTQIVGSLMRIEIGIESILLVGLHWWRLWRGMQQSLVREPLRSHLTGGFSGVSSTLAHAAGPIVAMYLLPLRLDRQLYVGTCAAYFFLLNTAKLPVYYAAGQFQDARLSFTMLALPIVLGGALFGLWLNKRMSDRLFTTVVYIITFVLGWYILIDGMQDVLHWWAGR